MAAAMTDGDSCECWTSIYWPEPEVDVAQGPSAVRATRCGDCAYRPDSPERQAGEDLGVYTVDRPFTCHQGMPVLRGWTHPELPGVCLLASSVGDRDDFGPIMHGGQAWQADGTPAEQCAGWAGVHGVQRRKVDA